MCRIQRVSSSLRLGFGAQASLYLWSAVAGKVALKSAACWINGSWSDLGCSPWRTVHGILYDKKDFACAMALKILRWGNYPELSEQTLNVTHWDRQMWLQKRRKIWDHVVGFEGRGRAIAMICRIRSSRTSASKTQGHGFSSETSKEMQPCQHFDLRHLTRTLRK